MDLFSNYSLILVTQQVVGIMIIEYQFWVEVNGRHYQCIFTIDHDLCIYFGFTATFTVNQKLARLRPTDTHVSILLYIDYCSLWPSFLKLCRWTIRLRHWISKLLCTQMFDMFILRLFFTSSEQAFYKCAVFGSMTWRLFFRLVNIKASLPIHWYPNFSIEPPVCRAWWAKRMSKYTISGILHQG